MALTKDDLVKAVTQENLYPRQARKFPPNFTGGAKMFWIGLIIGLFIGANVGLILFGLVASKKINGDGKRYHSELSEASMCCI